MIMLIAAPVAKIGLVATGAIPRPSDTDGLS